MKYDELYEDGMQKWEEAKTEILPIIVSRRPSSVKWAVTGSLVGILGMYFFDPEKGRTRRSLFRDKFFKLTSQLQQFGGKQFQNAKTQLKGWEAGLNRIQHTATNGSLSSNISSNKSKNRDQSFN